MRNILILGTVFSVGLVFAAPQSPIGFDLAEKDAYIASLKAKIDNPDTTPLEKRNTSYKLLKAEMLVCEDAEYSAKEASILKLISEQGDLSASDYVTFLYKTVRRDNYGYPNNIQHLYTEPDVDDIGFKATEDDAAARYLYYSLRIAAMTEIANGKSLNPKYSREARLELIGQAEKDPLMAGHEVDIVVWRLAALMDLGRDAEYVKVAEDALNTTNESKLVAVNKVLAGFYRSRAKRFYADPDSAMLEKAEACYAKIIEIKSPLKRINTDESIARQGMAECRFARKDYDACRAMLAEMKEKGYITRPRDIRLMSELLGDCAYAEEKWQDAVDAYAVAGDKMTDVPRMLRYAGALVAIGRKDDAILIVESASKSGNSLSKSKCLGFLKKLRER